MILRLRVEQRQQAVLRDLMLVVEGFIGLLDGEREKECLNMLKALVKHLNVKH